MAVQEQRVSVGSTQLGQQAIQRGVVGVVQRAQPRLQVVEAQGPGEDGGLPHRVGAHDAAAGPHLSGVVL